MGKAIRNGISSGGSHLHLPGEVNVDSHVACLLVRIQRVWNKTGICLDTRLRHPLRLSLLTEQDHDQTEPE